MAQRNVVAWTPLFLLVISLSAWRAQSNFLVSLQGAGFCRNMVSGLSYCPEIETADDMDLKRFAGKWYLVGTNAQNEFSYFGQQGAQCQEQTFTLAGRADGHPLMKANTNVVIFGNAIRQMVSTLISQNAGAAGLGVRFLCQFIVGQDPLATVIPELQVVANASKNVYDAVNLKQHFNNLYTAAVRGAVGDDDPLLTAIFDSALKPVVAQATRNVAAATPVINNPATGAALNMIQSYSMATNQALTAETVNVNGLSNLIRWAVLTVVFKAKIVGRISVASYEMTTAAARVSQFSEQVYTALDIIQRENLILVTTPWPYVAANISAGNIFNQTQRILWLCRRMQVERMRMGRSAKKILARVNATDQLGQAASAIAVLAQDKGPINVAIDNIVSSANDIANQVLAIGPGISIARVQDWPATAVQKPGQSGVWTVVFPSGRKIPYNIIKVGGSGINGYEFALIWSCKKDWSTGFLPENTFYLISRSRQPPQNVVTAAMKYLRNNNVILGGDNVFLRSVQDFRTCHPIFTLGN